MYPQGLHSDSHMQAIKELLTTFHDRAQWQLKFAWLPKRCLLSNKCIWLKFAYRGRAMYTGPGDPVFEDHWHETTEHIIWQLKQ
jgi:phage-related protein